MALSKELELKLKQLADAVGEYSITDEKVDGFDTKDPFYKDNHRKEITTLFLNWFFGLIIFSFCFCFIYNWVLATHFNQTSGMKPLDVANIVPIITTTLGTGMGFIIGYYFKGNQ